MFFLNVQLHHWFVVFVSTDTVFYYFCYLVMSFTYSVWVYLSYLDFLVAYLFGVNTCLSVGVIKEHLAFDVATSPMRCCLFLC